MNGLSFKALALAAALTVGGTANAVTLNPDTGWNVFAFGAVGTYAKRFYDFTITSTKKLSITDGWTSGDQFQVFLNNASQGPTSVPVNGASFVAANYTAAFSNSDFSSWSKYIAAGTYRLTLLVLQRSGTDTADHQGAVRLDTTAVPLPAAGLMLIAGLGAVAAVRRRRT